MEYTQISKDKLLELLYEAYQAGCFGYMELKETQCEKIARQCTWQAQVPPTDKLHTESTVGLSYIYDSTPGIRIMSSEGNTLSFVDHLNHVNVMPAQQQYTITDSADMQMQQQMAQQEHIAMLIREQPEDYGQLTITIGDTSEKRM
jgi:hypothetical protein